MKYKVIEDDILDLIKDGFYQVGDQIESDTVLSEKYESSELTVNRALTNLAQKGYLKRIKGKGTYVESTTGHENESVMKHIALSEHIRQQGMEPGAKLVEYKIIKAKEVPEVMEEMRAEPDDLLHFFIRIRTGNGVPICYSITYMPVNQIPFLDVSVLDSGSLWEFLGTTNFKGISRAYHRITIDPASKEIVKYLNVKEGDNLLHSHHISKLKGSKPYAYVDNYFDPNNYEYEYQINSVIQ